MQKSCPCGYGQKATSQSSQCCRESKLPTMTISLLAPRDSIFRIHDYSNELSFPPFSDIQSTRLRALSLTHKPNDLKHVNVQNFSHGPRRVGDKRYLPCLDVQSRHSLPQPLLDIRLRSHILSRIALVQHVTDKR